MSGEAGANPIEALQGGELAETLAEAMAGLADMFDLIMEDAETVAQRDEVSSAMRVTPAPLPSAILATCA